jgi:hypothetical protein
MQIWYKVARDQMAHSSDDLTIAAPEATKSASAEVEDSVPR